jgi:histidyl-tRNA synthetase
MADPMFRTHHGMNDILPGEVEQWQALERLIHEAAGRFHFEEIRTPIMEQTELIARGIGQLTDIVSKEMFAFERGDDHYVLRPEGTAPVARSYIENHLDQRGGTQNLYYVGPMFRAEKPQKGRQRQFHQFGAEIMGSSDPIADVEIIRFMIYIVQQAGIQNCTLKLNSVGDPESRNAYKEALQNHFRPHLDELSEISQNRFEKNPLRILDSKEEKDQPFIASAPLITDFLNEECQEHHDRVKELLTALNIEFEEDPYLVRGLDYYTKTAFELISPDLGAQDALGGGGRYDLLVEELGGQPTPAVGFAAGMERLLIACEELGIELGTEADADLYIVTFGPDARAWALQQLGKFRQLGLRCTTDYAGRSMKAQMKDANRENAHFALIVGGNELESGKFTLRNMEDSEETMLDMDELIQTLATYAEQKG